MDNIEQNLDELTKWSSLNATQANQKNFLSTDHSMIHYSLVISFLKKPETSEISGLS